MSAIDPIYFIFGALFLAVLLAIEGAWFLFVDLRRGPGSRVNRRMRLLSGERDREEVLRLLRRQNQGGLARMMRNALPSFDQLIAQSGLSITLPQLILRMILFWGVLVILLIAAEFTLRVNAVQAIGLATLFALTVPILALYWLRRRRVKRFAEQLPEAIDLIVRGLRAGHPVNAAFSMVGKEMQDPIGTEFGIVVDEMTYGLSIDEALNNLTERMPHPDLKYMVIAIQIQYVTGGNLAEVLSKLSTVIRGRFQMFRKIRATSAEGRAGAFVIGGLPIVVGLAVNVMNPGYYGDSFNHPLFIVLMLLAFTLQIFGSIVLYKMVNFKV